MMVIPPPQGPGVTRRPIRPFIRIAYKRCGVATRPAAARPSEPASPVSGDCAHADAFDEALRLLAIAESGSPDELQQAQAELLRGQIAFSSNIGSDAPPLL